MPERFSQILKKSLENCSLTIFVKVCNNSTKNFENLAKHWKIQKFSICRGPGEGFALLESGEFFKNPAKINGKLLLFEISHNSRNFLISGN